MPLLKRGKLIDDPWTHIPDEVAIPASGPVIVSLDRWQNERQALLKRNHPIGIRLKAGQVPSEVADDLDRFDVVALPFPAFTDGRSYSNARRLRERHGYTGEVRAVGHVLRDQYLFLRRCGFDALEVREGETEADWKRATGVIGVAYQPAADRMQTARSLRRKREAAAAKKEAVG